LTWLSDDAFFLGWHTELAQVGLPLREIGDGITAEAVTERALLTTDRPCLAERFPSVAIKEGS
jgi:hypothetical protein